MTKMICIMCPLGCDMEVEKKGTDIKVDGNSCRRGDIYARTELISPQRIVTSLFPVTSGGVVSCKTSGTVNKTLIFPILNLIKKNAVTPPVRIGDVLIKNVFGQGVDIIATSNKD